MAAVDTESRLESLIRDQLLPQIARMDERLTGLEKRIDQRFEEMEKRLELRIEETEKRLDRRLLFVEHNVSELAKGVTTLTVQMGERPRTATVVGIVVSTVIGVVGLVIGSIALAPYLQP
ncbi:MAG: hypothetical protein GVY13_07660 [Alphaproteobacteria bacterium]|jgi:hypothetical protein|nr:hypothetical protein [Alphaproteobacteria bacterium]